MNRILIIEDQDTNIEILSDALGNDYKISVAKNGELALKILEAVNPDLILLDIVMPVMDGFETMKHIKSKAIYRDTPVIFLTANGELDARIKAFDLGAVDFIAKPFYTKEVVSRVKAHLALVESKQKVREKLSNTVIGATRTLVELMRLINPELHKIAVQSRQIASKLIEHLNVIEGWKIEVAIMLAYIGLLAIPRNEALLLLRGESLDNEYDTLFKKQHEISAKLVGQIPRFEEMSRMIQLLGENASSRSNGSSKGTIFGAQIIKVCYDFEIGCWNNNLKEDVILGMKQEPSIYPIQVVMALEKVMDSINKSPYLEITIQEVEKGMKLYEDIVNKEGKVLMEKNIVLNDMTKKHLELLLKYEVSLEKIKVYK